MIKNFVKSSLGIAIASLTVSAPTGAEAAILRCDGCTYFQVRDKAKVAGIGHHMVLDFSSGSLWQFDVSVNTELTARPGQPLPLLVESTTVLPEDSQAFSQIAQVWRENHGSLKLNVSIEPGDPNYPGNALIGFTASDIVYSVQIRESIGRSVARMGFTGTAGRLVGSFQSVILYAAQYVSDQAQVRVTLRLLDGSTAVFILDADNSLQARYELGSARDPEGNIVPDQSHAPGGANRMNLLGGFRFSNEANFNTWFQRAEMFGIPVTDSRGPSRENRPIIVECVNRPDGGLQCTARFASL